MDNIYAVILAAGRGTRMNTNLPKSMMPIAGKKVIYWPLQLLKDLEITNIVVVNGFKAGLVEEYIKSENFSVTFVRQDKPTGTAHSLKLALKYIPKNIKTVLVFYGDDSVLYLPNTIKRFLNYHLKTGNVATFLTLEREIPTDIGALEVDKKKNVIGVLTLGMIVKAKLKKHQILCGAFCFDRTWVEKVIPLISPSSLSGEYNLPGLIKVSLTTGDNIKSYKFDKANEWHSINTQGELNEAEKLKLKQIAK